MSAIIATTRAAYYAPTRGRHFFTKRAAAVAEAGAMLSKKYPFERGDPVYGPGDWHWASDEHLVRVRDRLARFIERKS